jgi:Leucine-rich repeat (LRR) protein
MSKQIHIYNNDLRMEKDNTYERRIKSYLDSDFDKDTLDLSNLDLNNLNNLPNVNLITHLFISANKLSGLLDVSNIINLLILDICDNKITSIKLPNKLNEFMFDNNQISELPKLTTLKRLQGCNNNLTFIHEYPSLEILIVSNNYINNLNNCLSLKKLIINDNPINKLYNMNTLEYLDISNTKLQHVNYNFENLIHLVNNYNTITDLPDKNTIPKITCIEVISTPINKINFYPLFDIIICSLNLTKNISSKYKDVANIKIKNNTIICITKF